MGKFQILEEKTIKFHLKLIALMALSKFKILFWQEIEKVALVNKF